MKIIIVIVTVLVAAFAATLPKNGETWVEESFTQSPKGIGLPEIVANDSSDPFLTPVEADQDVVAKPINSSARELKPLSGAEMSAIVTIWVMATFCGGFILLAGYKGWLEGRLQLPEDTTGVDIHPLSHRLASSFTIRSPM